MILYKNSAILLLHTQGSNETYVGQTGFGATTVVRSTVYDDYGIVLDDDPALFEKDTGLGIHKATFRIDMDNVAARSVKPFLRVLLIGTLARTQVYKGIDSRSATWSSPSEHTTNKRYVVIAPEELWLFDNRNGKVLLKRTMEH